MATLFATSVSAIAFALIGTIACAGEKNNDYSAIEAQGYTMRTVGPNTLVNIKNMSSDVIAKIKETEARDMINVTDVMRVNEKIIKTKNLIFNPRSRLEWRTPETPHNENYVILAAEKLILNAPNAADDIALLKLIAPKAKDDLKGEGGTTGPEGWTSGHDDGRDGGPGNPGGTGHPGKTYDWPIIYMVFQELVVNSANPAILSALRVEGHGVAGGDGGRGGQGGVGGHGSRGTPGARKCVSLLPICGCSSGPGKGAQAGRAGLEAEVATQERAAAARRFPSWLQRTSSQSWTGCK